MSEKVTLPQTNNKFAPENRPTLTQKEMKKNRFSGAEISLLVLRRVHVFLVHF